MFNFKRRQEKNADHNYSDQILEEISYIHKTIIDLTHDINLIKHEAIKKTSLDQIRNTLGVSGVDNRVNKKFRLQVIEKIKHYLSVLEYMTATDILEMLKKDGIFFESKRPLPYVSCILSTSNDFEYDKRQGYGWRLKQKSSDEIL